MMKQFGEIRSLALFALMMLLAACSQTYSYVPSMGKPAAAPPEGAQVSAETPAAAPAPAPDLPKQVQTLEARVQQLEARLTEMEAQKAAPAGPGREVNVKPGERGEGDKPSANLSGVDRQSRFSTKTMKDRGSMVRDDVRSNLEGVRFTPPPEIRGKFEAYMSTLARSKVVAPVTGRPAPARPARSGGQ